MITRERIEALRAEHEPCDCGAEIAHCLFHEADDRWPCGPYAAFTLALEAETLRTALEGIENFAAAKTPEISDSMKIQMINGMAFFGQGKRGHTLDEIKAARAALGGAS